MSSSKSQHFEPYSRRKFLQAAAIGGLSVPWMQAASAAGTEPGEDESFDQLCRWLLRSWCDGMLKQQIHDPSNPARHGALACPSCDFIHGRCMDAVYPFLHMARTTGERKYLDAGKSVFEWSENVSHPDGSWTVIKDPKSWKGITVFGAISLAEALHRHGDLLDADTRDRWHERLGRAGDYLYGTFTSLDFSNINYGCTGIFAFVLLDQVLGRPSYTARSRELAAGLEDFVTVPNGLLLGEGKPARATSPRGCHAVDLGYNVEESVAALAQCAKITGDAKLEALVIRLLHSHLEFMLPDGGWDNSWGTRQAKWTYWGSRTTDGCQPGYALFAERFPVFATAVVENTHLYRRCTADGLLHGGPHYISHGVKPCVHHTFTHAKALAALCDHGDLTSRLKASAPLPRAVADGVRHYPETAVWLAARGPWRATVSACDVTYHEQVRQPTGGVISMLWHAKAGPLFAGSMAKYFLVEKNNMQLHPDGEDHPLAPRIELLQNGGLFTQLHELNADVVHTDRDRVIEFRASGRLLDEAQQEPESGKSGFSMVYRIDDESFQFIAEAPGVGSGQSVPRLMLPLVSANPETVKRPSNNRIEIHKPGCVVVIEANAPLKIMETRRSRIFNLVPGFEAVPIIGELPSAGRLECRIRVLPS